MSLRVEIETWVRALEAYDRGDFSASLDEFSQMDHTARIAFNIGVIYATLGSHDEAIGAYARAVGRDRYLAVAYFQAGVSQFLLGRFEAAHRSFSDALLHLRGNNYIDYDQLGLHFKLYACECLFNRGLCAVYLQQRDIGLKEITSARNCKVVKEHDVIDEAIRESAEGYTVFSIPVGVLYRPSEAKIRHVKEHSNHHHQPKSHSTKTQQLQQILQQRNAPPSRLRQQSEPPINRVGYPPTPPPETSLSSTQGHVRRRSEECSPSLLSGTRRGPRPKYLDLGPAAFDFSRNNNNHSRRRRADSETHDLRNATSSLLSASSSTIPEEGYAPEGPASRPTQAMAKLRVKVHCEEEIRWVVVNTPLSLSTLEEAIARKFPQLGERTWRTKTKDEEGDLITLADQEDLDLAVMVWNRRRVGEGEMGRLEVWVV